MAVYNILNKKEQNVTLKRNVKEVAEFTKVNQHTLITCFSRKNELVFENKTFKIFKETKFSLNVRKLKK